MLLQDIPSVAGIVGRYARLVPLIFMRRGENFVLQYKNFIINVHNNILTDLTMSIVHL